MSSLRALALTLLGLGLLAAAEAERVYIHQGGGRFTWREAPADVDPAGAPAGAILATLDGRIGDKQIEAVVTDLVDRIEAAHATSVDASVVAWLGERPEIRRAFWLALDPRYDDPAAAVAVLGALIAHDVERVERFHHLAIAFAVVHDSPDAVRSSRLAMIWAVDPGQFPEMPGMLEVFDYLTEPTMLKRMPYPPDKLVWPLLVHLADYDLPASERDWVLGTFQDGKGDLSATYAMVPYDYDKLKGKPKLGSKPYVLANVLKQGGVCVDQAHFSSRVMKSFGIPAIKVSGEGRYGGAGHAWTGFLQASRKGARFAFTGRYNFDFYYTGDVFDPQTRTSVLDRALAMDLDGALHDYGTYVDAGATVRVARQIRGTDPETSLRLCEHALELNPFVAQGWSLLGAHIAAGTLDLKAATRWLNTMAKNLQPHPDMTLTVLDTVLDVMPASDLKERDKLYAAIFTLYRERPDLQIRLRERQCAELYAAGEADRATSYAVQTLIANAEEGTLILPLVEVVVGDCSQRPPAQRARVKAMLGKVDDGFPKMRGSTPSQAYAEFKQLLGRL